MRRTTLTAAAAVFLLAAFSGPSSAGESLSLKDIIQKNLEASGGREKITQVQNLSFRTGNTRFVVASTGELKLSTGKDPVITEAVLVKGGRVQRNYFDTTTDLADPEKTVYLTLARLYAGLFTLVKFEKELKLEGLVAYGPEKLYHLTLAGPGAMKVGFFLRPEDFRLKRLVFQGKTAEGDIFEYNTDFGPFEAVEGFELPLSWFTSQVGTRGSLAEVTAVKINQPLGADFFTGLKINIGAVEASPGHLKGNVLDFNSSPFGLMIVTNWRKGDVEKAGFRTGDRLAFLVEGAESEVVFYSSTGELPDQGELMKGARLLAPMPRGGESYVVQFIAVDAAPIAAKLKPLTPIEARKR